MDQYNFEKTAHRATSALQEQGYQIKSDPTLYTVEFWKIHALGVGCLIGFDFFQKLLLPNKFKVILIRRRLEDFALDDSQYKPLYFDLRNLMFGLFKKSIFPPDQYAWEFKDEISLLTEIENAQALLISHGIKWLEDPRSNVDWVKNPGRQDKA